MSPAVLSHPSAPNDPEPNAAAPGVEDQPVESPSYVPYEAPERPSIFSLPLTPLDVKAPFRWLKQGWDDFRCCPAPGLFYGLVFCLMGHALWQVFEAAPAYLLALSAGFLLLGPFLCLGLYHASKQIEEGKRPSLRASMLAWMPTKGAMGIFAGVLLILEMLWGRASLIVFAVAFTPIPGVEDTLRQLLHPDNWGFLATYVAVGGVFAGLIFGMSAIAIPMIMDREVDAVSAALTSLRACAQNPGVMLLWGATITLLVGLAMLPYFVGLVVVGPVIGHATWHAYRHIVTPTTPSAA